MLIKPRTFVFALSMMMLAAFLTAAPVFASEKEDPVDNFKLEAINSDEVFELKKDKHPYVALHFLLKTECPLCLMYTQTYFQNAKEFPNVKHLFIKPDSADEIKAWAKKLDVEGEKQPTIFHDPNAKLAKQYKIPDGYQFHGEEVHYPALILLNQEGEEVFRYVGEGTRDRFTFDKFKKKMEEMSS